MFAKSKKSLSVNELLNAVDAARDQIAALRQDRAAVETAPRPIADVLADLDQHLDSLATSAVDSLSLHQLRDRRGMTGLRLSQSGNPDFAIQTLFGLVVAVAREPLRQVIIGQMEDLEATRPGMAEADRVAKITEIDKAVLQAEMGEERAIRDLERQGVQIQRRSDLNPLVALAADQALPVQ